MSQNPSQLPILSANASQADVTVLRSMIEEQNRRVSEQAVIVKQIRDILTGNGNPESGLVYKVSEVNKLATGQKQMLDDAKNFLKKWGTILAITIVGGPQALDAVFQQPAADPTLTRILETLIRQDPPAAGTRYSPVAGPPEP